MRNVRAYRLNTFLLMLGVTACFLCILPIAQPCWGQSTGQPEAKKTGEREAKKTKAPTDWVHGEIMKYAAKRYSVVGPITVSAVDPNYLALFTGVKPIQIRLAKKKITVKNHDGKDLSLGDVKRGKRVYVCRKKNEVIILLVKDTKPPRGDKVLD